jgi:hypothetical protein
LHPVGPRHFGGSCPGSRPCRHPACAKHVSRKRDEELFEAPEKRAKEVREIAKESTKPPKKTASAGPLISVVRGFRVCLRMAGCANSSKVRIIPTPLEQWCFFSNWTRRGAEPSDRDAQMLDLARTTLGGAVAHKNHRTIVRIHDLPFAEQRQNPHHRRLGSQ